MKENKHALVLFTKYPEPGSTKTRLMEKYGGNLTPEEASNLYKAMLLDTVEVGISGISKCNLLLESTGDYQFYISSSPENTMGKVQEMFEAEFPDEKFGYIVDKGKNFNEHFDDCFCQLFDQGFSNVVCIGGDLPGMPPDIIYRSFKWLLRLSNDPLNGAMVSAPCQAGGVSLVGMARNTPIDFRDVFYNEEGVTALDAIIQSVSAQDIPFAMFETLADVDNVEDLGHTISVLNAMEYAAFYQKELLVPKRTLSFIRETDLCASSPPNESRDSRRLIDG